MAGSSVTACSEGWGLAISPNLTDKKTYAEMVAETLREAGVLFMVFGMLDPLLQHYLLEESDLWTTGAAAGLALIFGGTLILVGMILEKERA